MIIVSNVAAGSGGIVQRRSGRDEWAVRGRVCLCCARMCCRVLVFHCSHGGKFTQLICFLKCTSSGAKDSNGTLLKVSVSITRDADCSIGAQLCEYLDEQLDVD